MNPIQQFQKQHGLVPDGIVGPATANKIKDVYEMTRQTAAHFLGQCHVETGGFRLFEESLNYSAIRLIQVFSYYKKRPWMAYKHAGNKQAIANHAYAYRGGNGSPESGDGYKYRGRTPIQLTTRNNYKKAAERNNDQRILTTPDVVLEPKYFFKIPYQYFRLNHGLWLDCGTVSRRSIERVSGWVNRGNPNKKALHLNERINETYKYYSWLK